MLHSLQVIVFIAFSRRNFTQSSKLISRKSLDSYPDRTVPRQFPEPFKSFVVYRVCDTTYFLLKSSEVRYLHVWFTKNVSLSSLISSPVGGRFHCDYIFCNDRDFGDTEFLLQLCHARNVTRSEAVWKLPEKNIKIKVNLPERTTLL